MTLMRPGGSLTAPMIDDDRRAVFHARNGGMMSAIDADGGVTNDLGAY